MVRTAFGEDKSVRSGTREPTWTKPWGIGSEQLAPRGGEGRPAVGTLRERGQRAGGAVHGAWETCRARRLRGW